MMFCLMSVLILLVRGEIIAQPITGQSAFVMDQWGIENGLPVNNVKRLLQSEQGYIWMATFDGLVRFDGIRFEVYQSENYPELPSNRLVNLFETADGALWMVTEQGFLVRFKNGEFRQFRSEDGLNGDICNGIFRENSGRLWFSTELGVSRYNDDGTLSPYLPDIINKGTDRVFVQHNGVVWYRVQDTQQLYRIENGKAVHLDVHQKSQEFLPFLEASDGTVWLGADLDIYTFTDHSLQKYTTIDPAATGLASFGEDRDGHVWVSTIDNGFYRLQDGGSVHFEPSSGEMFGFFNSFQLDSENHFWKFSGNSVWRDGGNVLTVESGINDYFFDREGSLWVGTNRTGLVRLKPNPFTVISSEDGLPNPNIYPVLEDHNATFWVGTFGGGLGKIVDKSVVPCSECNSFQSGSFLSSLAVLSDGSVMAGLAGGGIKYLSPGSNLFRKMTNPEAFSQETIFAIYEQSNLDLWVGSSGGLYLRTDGNWQHFSRNNGFSNHSARFFLEAPNQSMWMATNGDGIANYENGSFKLYNSENGFPSNLVRSLYIEPDSDPDNYILWIGTEDRGLVRLEIVNGNPVLANATVYSRASGMLDYVIHIILQDDYQNFWFNTNRGIFTVAKEQLELYHRGEINEIKGISYNESDGLRNREGNGGMQWAGIRASNGNLWLPTQDGVVIVDPAGMTKNNLPPPVLIESLQSRTRTLLFEAGATMHLARNERDFEIRYTALSLLAPEKNEFRYRLHGYNDTWIEAGQRRSTNYTNIPAGTYTFEVAASNNSGIWSTETASISIEIAPFFYETLWFRLFMLALVGFVFYSGLRWRVHKLEQNELRLRNLVLERTEELSIEKQKTEEQAEKLKELDIAKSRFFTNISHEFRTPLTLIISPLQRMLSSSEDLDSQTQNEYERMLRNSGRLLRLIDQTLELTQLEHGKLKLQVQEIELNEFLHDLTELFKPVCSDKQITLLFIPAAEHSTVMADPDKLDKIVANLLSNAIKFTPSGGAITVQVVDKIDYFEVEVHDTGIGIPPDEHEKVFDRFYQVDSSETRRQEGSGVGLSLARDFARRHQGDVFVQSEVHVGSVFTLLLKKGSDHFTEADFAESDQSPVAIHPANQDPLPASDTSDDSGNDTGKPTILIVEDNADLRSFIRELFSVSSNAIEATNGKQALEMVTNNLPDVIIADIMMPEMDGISFNRELKKDPSTASIPLLFLTAKSAKEHQLEGLDEGADDYITKPFDPELLKARVGNLIKSRLRLRELLSGNDNGYPENAKRSAPADPFIQKVDEILSVNFRDPDFNVNKLAEHLFMERSNLLRKMKEIAGISPKDYIIKYRMEEASRLLQENAGSVSEVAYAVGYNSLAYFSYAFKEFHGKTPSAFVTNE